MRIARLTVAFGLSVLASTAIARSVPPMPDPPVSGQVGGCLTVAQGTRVVALGAYEAGEPVSFFAPSDSSDAGVITVAGDRDGPPVVLVLSAYDPVIWDLRQVPKKRLRGIVAYGYSAVAVVGVPRSIPVRFATRRAANLSCGYAGGVYKGGAALEQLAVTVAKAIGHSIDAFYGGYAPQGLHIDGKMTPLSDAKSITLDMLYASETFRVSEVPPKQAGITMLLQQGAIRLVTREDSAALDAAQTRASPTGHLAPVHTRLRQKSYVVLRPITVPRGMYGGYSAIFLIAPGVPMPIDPGSHNTYFDLADGRCVRGSGCGSDD